MPPDTPCPSAELLRRSLDPDDPMPAPERQRIEAHVDCCTLGCKLAIDVLLRGNTLPLATGGTLLGNTPGASAAAGPPGDATLASDAPPPSIRSLTLPGYEILEEIGRGGMGVVYKARQVGLNRLVALKMILAGVHAAVDDLARFRSEAEAVAALQHPNVVQIYDIGAQDGRPYFSLEYVEGGNLAQQLAGSPQPPRRAAELVETLARAVHFAHQRGIVHRDLKPANVLLTAEGRPKITDFGLVKRLDEESSRTRTGAVMGTPSYMAPEQAAGKSKAVGPATDVYALGAMLYECLTGRPPFRAATALETLQQVLQDEPAPPRQLQSKTPRDLETICLKCLAKDPARRYTSAWALAEDLRQFQAGQPIQARPTALPERMLKWVKRRPAVAALTAAATSAVLVGLVTSWVLAAWAFHERDRATGLLTAAQQADRRRVQAQVEELGSAAPEAVPRLLAALAQDREAIRPRLLELWTGEGGDRRRRMRAGLALLDEDPSLRDALADWMLDAEEPREVLLVREVLAPHGAELAERLWHVAEDAKGKVDVRFRALAALAAFDPADPRWDQAAPTAVEHLLKADPLHLGAWLEALRAVRGRLHGPLVEVFRGRNPALADRRLVAATALADYAADRPAVLADLACEADADQFAILRPILEKNSKEAQAALTAALSNQAPAQENEVNRIARARRQANAAAALVVLGAPDAAWPLTKHSRTPDARTVLIHGLAPRGADPRVLIRRLEEEKDDSIRAALILALGEYTADQVPTDVRTALTPKLLAAYRDDPDPGVHGAIDWLLRQGKEGPVDRPLDWDGRADLEKIDAELAGKPGRAGQRWYVNGQGQALTAVRGPVEFAMGSREDEPGRGDDEILHRRTISRSFAIAARPVTVTEWEAFTEAMKKAKLEVGHSYTKRNAPEPGCPILSVTWYEAAMYCRWLSEVEQVPEKQMVYPPSEDILKCADGQTPLKLPTDHLLRTGYRLPTEAEFEYACRADASTRWDFGGAEEFLPRHAWFVKNSEDRTWPAGQKKPNELGLFDMHGGVWVWCQGGYQRYNPAGMEDSEDDRSIMDGVNCVLRGGAFSSPAWVVRSANRNRALPSYRNYNVGFRPARTLPPDHFAVSSPE